MSGNIKVIKYRIDGFPKCKAAVVADLHNGPYKKVVESLLSEKPDIILIPGDLSNVRYVFSDSAHKYLAENAIGLLKECVKLAPTFYSRGNHECSLDESDVAFIKDLGVSFLDNGYEIFGDFAIGGLSGTRIMNRRRDRLPPDAAWLSDYAKEPYFHILLAHHPEHWEKYIKDKNIELTVSGHTHGGQMTLFGKGIYAPGQGFFPKYTKGVYNGGRLIISAGLSNTAKPVPRLFNPKELLYLE